MNFAFSLAPIELPQQLTLAGGRLPLILAADASPDWADAEAWLRENREQLARQAFQHGAILFRGLPLKTAEDFDAFVQTFDFPNFPYNRSLSNAVRVNYTPRVFSANEAPPEVTIRLHHEMAQTPIYPSKLFFFCQQAAEEGGATPVCRSDSLYEKLAEVRPQFISHCEQHGVKYSNVMPPENDFASGMGRSWRSTFRAEDRQEAEQRMRELGYSWEWQDDGCLRATTPMLQPVRDLGDGRKAFFNQLIAAFAGWKDSRNDPSKAIRFGNGSSLDPEDVQQAIELSEAFTFDIPWRSGDVALVDNFVAMHGRRTFSGTRKVLASLAK